MSAALIPSGWGYRATRPVRASRARLRAVAALRNADPALLAVPCGVLARDLARKMGMKYQLAFDAVRHAKLTRARGAW